MLLAEQTRSVLKLKGRACWFGGHSSRLGCDLGPMSHSVVSLTKHISRCTKDVRMMEYKTEESNELKRKEVESNKESINKNVERFMTFHSDLDIENEEETAAYNNMLIKDDLDIKLFIGKEIRVTKKIEKLQKDIQSVNGAAGFVPVMSSTPLGENIDPHGSEFEHEVQQKNLEEKIDTGRNVPMKRKWLNLRKANQCVNIAAGLLPEVSSASLDDSIDANASEYEHELDQKNLEIMNLRGGNIPVRHKLFQLRKAHEWLKAAAALLPAVSSASLGENINPHGSAFEHALHQQNLEDNIDKGRKVAMKQKLLNLKKATQSQNSADDLEPAMSISTFLGDNIDHSASQYKNQLEQENLEMKIMQGRNVAMKDKFLQLRKAHEWLKAAAALLPAMSSESLGKNINPNASEYERELQLQNLEMKIDTERNVAMKHKWLKLQKANQCVNIAAELLPEVSSASLNDAIDPSASAYEHELDWKNLEVMNLRERYVPIKHKLFQLRKAHEWLKVAAALLPAKSSPSLGNNINSLGSKFEHELHQKNLEVKTDTGGKVPMKHKWLKLQKANQCVKIAAGLLSEVSSASLDDGIDPSASEYEYELDQKNLEVMNLRGRNVPMKHKLFQLQKAHEWLKVAAALLPAKSSPSLGNNINPLGSKFEHELHEKNLEVNDTGGKVPMKHKLIQLRKAHEWLKAAAALLPAVSSASLGEHIDLHGSEFEHELHQQNLEVKIDTGRNVPKKYKLLNLKKATQLLNSADDLEPAMSISTFLGDDIDHSASQYKNQQERQNLEMKIMQGRNVAMKDKLLQLRKAHEWLKAAAALLAAESSASLSKNVNPHASEYEFELQQENLEVKINTARNTAKKQKWLKLRKANHCINIVAGLLSEVSSASLDDGIHPSASEYEHELDQKNLEVVNLRGRNVPIKHKLIQPRKAHEWLKAAADLLPAVSSASLGKNINSLGSEFEHEVHQKNLEAKTDTGGNVPMKHKWLKLQKANQCVKIAAGLLPEMSSASLDDGIDPSALEYEHELDWKNLDVMNLRGKNVPVKHKLFQLWKAHEWLKAAAGLLPAVSSASLGEHINLRGSEFEHELQQQNLEAKIEKGKNVPKKYKLLNLKKATQLLNSADDLEPAMPISTFLGDDIDHSVSQCKNQLEQQNLEMKFLWGKNVAMKDKLLQLKKDIQYLNAAHGILPAKSSASLDKNINLNSSGHKHEVEQKNLEMKILRERHTAMKRKLLKLCNASQSINVPAGLVRAMPALTSLGDNVDPSASEYEHQLELKDMDHRTSSTYQHLQNRMTCWI